MDTLTHTVLGACLGEAIAGKQLGKKAMLIGALANNFPDVDVAASFFTEPAHNLLVHRGITHSILSCLIFTFLFSWIFKSIYKNKNVSWNQWLLLFGSGLFLHIGMDACTSYGTGWFEPFSDYRVSFNTLFILDPFFLLPLLIGAVILLILKKTSLKRAITSAIVLIISFAYLGITLLIKIYINKTISSDLAQQNIRHSDYMTTPTPLNNLLWYVVAKDSDNCKVSYYSVFDKSSKLDYDLIPMRDSLLNSYSNSIEVKDLKQFSKNYYTVNKTDSSLLFSDLRFGQIGGWYDPQAPFVFSFDITRKNNAAHIQQGRMRSIDSKPITELVKRIKGR